MFVKSDYIFPLKEPMTSLAVPDCGELCPICFKHYIDEYMEINNCQLCEQEINFIWTTLGTSSYFSIRFHSSKEYNMHIQLHSSEMKNLDMKIWTNTHIRAYFGYNFDTVYVKCSKCYVLLNSVESAKNHFKIHDFFDEKFGYLSKYIDDCISFLNDSGFICCELCKKYIEKKEITLENYYFGPMEFINHIEEKHLITCNLNLI